MKPLLIIGLDPGTTIGYAVLDIRGKLLETDSSKQLNLSAVISRIIEIGKPLVVGCDVTPAPRFVEKFATKTGSKLIEPEEDMLVEEKNAIVKGFETEDAHQKDALASALFAFKSVKPLLDKTDKILEKLGKENLSNNVKELVIKNNISIRSAVLLLEKPAEEAKALKEMLEQKIPSGENFIELYENLKKAEKDLALLRQQNQKLEQKASHLEKQNQFMVKRLAKLIPQEKVAHKFYLKENNINVLNQEIEYKKGIILSLQKEIAGLNSLISSISQNTVIAKKLNTLGYKEFESKKDKLNITKGDILLVDDADSYSKTTLDELKNKVSLIIAKKISAKTKKELPISAIDSKNIDIKENVLFALVDKKEVEDEKGKQDILTKVISDYKRERQL